MKMPQLPNLPQATDITPVSWSNLFSVEQMRAFALAYGEAVREECAKENRTLLLKCRQIAEWHIGDGDECGQLAREVYAAIRHKEE